MSQSLIVMTAIESDIIELEKIPIIRTFHPQDLDEVAKLNKISFPNPYSVMTFTSIYEQLPNGFLVAEIDGNVIGYAMSRITSSFSFRHFRYEKEGHIVSIAVAPEYRSLGYGAMLLNRTLLYLEQNEHVSRTKLEVRTDNRIAQEMYIKKGFVFERIIPSYYRDGASAYVMARIAKN